MTTKELENFKWDSIVFAEQADAKILVLVSNTNESAELFYKALLNEGFMTTITEDEKNRFGIHIRFTKGEVIGIGEPITIEEYPQLAWLKNGQITHTTVGYKDENNKTQLLPYRHLLSDNLLKDN